MPRRSRLRSGAAVAALLVVGARHPMHTAVAEIRQDQRKPSTEISIRMFADDFGAAVSLAPKGAAVDSAMSRYVRGRFAVADRSGRPLPLHWIGAEREGDVVLLHLAFSAPGGLGGARVLSALLCERFPDQINIVRASYAGRSATLIFTSGDAAKALP
jgi:uncharacterized protein DUF6702